MTGPIRPTMPAADLTLRFGETRLPARVYWPPAAIAEADFPLALLLPGTDEPHDLESADQLGRGLCSAAPTVVLLVPSMCPTSSLGTLDRDYEISALEWAAEHAGELGADPGRLIVAGRSVGGAGAAWLAIRAGDSGWPELRRQVLVHPKFTPPGALPSSVAGVAPATVVSTGAPSDDGSRYAAQLRSSGVEVDELRQPLRSLLQSDEPRALLFAALGQSVRVQ